MRRIRENPLPMRTTFADIRTRRIEGNDIEQISIAVIQN